MAKVPWFPFYVSDWLGSRKVLLMTDAQRGIYITLLAHQWSDPSCSIPTERIVLQKMLPGSKWKNIEYIMRECFEVQGSDGERARNARLNVEQARAIGKSEKAREAVKIRELLKLQRTNDNRTIIERSSNQIPQSQSQPETPKVKRKDRPAQAPFTPPTLVQVQEYCTERKNTVNAQKFVDWYESNGWLVGKNRMKSWQAAVRTWEARNDGPQNGSGQRSGNGVETFRERDARLYRERNERLLRGSSGVLGINDGKKT